MQVDIGARTAPVILESDVVVVGGGSAGLAAAITAARLGVRTALIERYGFFGGNAVSAYVGTICGLYISRDAEHDVLTTGFASSWADDLRAAGGFGPVPFKESAVFLYVPWAFKRQADRWVGAEPLLTPLLHSTITDVITSGRAIDAVVIGSKRGPLAVTGRVFVDASGDADLAFHAGCIVHSGLPRQFPSMQFLMENVDVQAAWAAGLGHLNDLLAGEGQQPAWNLSRTAGAVLPTMRTGEVIGAMTRIGVDGRSPDMTDPFEATAAEIAGRQEAETAARFLASHMPGFGDSFLADTPTQLGVRETRRVAGNYELTGEDVRGAARFDDAVATGAWPLEFHTEGKHTRFDWLERGSYYQVPMRSLIAEGVDNLLVAGRCISASHEALASTRVIAPSMAQGEAAGVAAALAVTSKAGLTGIDAADVQASLRDRGAFLG